MNSLETAVHFDCAGDRLAGIAHVPAEPRARGVIVITGGPQYRAGSHRQFTLLSRQLAANNFASLRFDYRGMGDSEGEPRSFERIDDDVRAAVDALIAHAPAVREIALWGLCDAASAALLYAHRDSRVTGVALLNPWVRSESGIAEAYLKHYYLGRLFERELWSRIIRGEFRPIEALTSFAGMMRARFRGSKVNNGSDGELPFQQRMLDGIRRFRGRILIILSGNDLTAAEFAGHVSRSREWREILHAPRVARRELSDANHTFSSAQWRAQVETWTIEWMQSW